MTDGASPEAAWREPTLADILKFCLKARLYIAAGAAIGLAGGALLLLLAVPHYRASMIVGPTTRAATMDSGGPAPDHSSFATEYMLKSFSPGDASDFSWFEHIVQGPSVADRLLRDGAIRAGLAKDVRFKGFGGRAPATPEDLSAYLDGKVSIEPVGSTPLRRIVYSHPDRAFAIAFLNALRREGDDLIREQMKERAERRLRWLEAAIAHTANPDYRRALTALLTDQEQMRMMLSLDEPYAARVAEPASASLRPSWPRASLVLPVMLVCGAFAGLSAFGLRRCLGAP